MVHYEKFIAGLSLAAVALLTMGVNRCQENYKFADQVVVPTETSVASSTPTANGSETATPTPTEDPDGDGDDDGNEATATATATETPENGPAIVNGDDLFQINKKKKESSAAILGELSQLGQAEDGPQEKSAQVDAKSDQESDLNGLLG
jgi:hypothetical protein